MNRSKKVDTRAIDRAMKRLRAVAQIGKAELTPLLEQWEDVIVEDNRKGVLAGRDKDDQPMAPVTYRTGAVKTKVNARSGGKFGSVAGSFKGGSNGNLSPAQYRRLTGPPTAPRGEDSRVITNLVTRHGRRGAIYFAEGKWDNVVDAHGKPFLAYMFKRRNLKGVRPWGRAKAKALALAFIRDLIKRA